MTKKRTSPRAALDARLAPWAPWLLNERRPPKGWVRAIRDGLGMTSTELAVRLGVSQSTVSELEHSEMRDTAKLGSLRRAADALDCELVYILVPRTSLADTVRAQARRKAEMMLHAGGLPYDGGSSVEELSEPDGSMGRSNS
jgi:predicted DNA-binding mobile mystery protein A